MGIKYDRSQCEYQTSRLYGWFIYFTAGGTQLSPELVVASDQNIYNGKICMG